MEDELRQRIEAARRRLCDLKRVYAVWYDGKDARESKEIINEMELIAFSAICYLDGVTGPYRRPA